MHSKGFNLEAASSPNYMGLTVTAGNEYALIVGWDGSKYTLETESGRRLSTADYVWNYDDMADPDVMQLNAFVAALRSEDSPYKGLGGTLKYDPHTGGWDARVGDNLLSRIALELDEEEDYDLEPEDQEVNDDEAKTHELCAALEEAMNADPSEMDEVDRAFMKALPKLLEAAADENIDGSEDPDIQEFLRMYEAATTDEEPGEDFDFVQAHVKTAFLPALGLAASTILPALGRGAVSGIAQGVMSNLGLGGLAGGTEQTPQINVQRQEPYGYRNDPTYARVEMDSDHLWLHEQKQAGSELVDAMRAQVENALTAVAPKAKDIWGEHGDDLWYALMDSVTSAKSIASLQSILQTLPPEYHTAPGPVGALDNQDAPTPEVMGLGAPPAGGDSIPVTPEPGPTAPSAGGMGDAGPTGLGGGPLTPGGPGPGAAPGGGIPGGPGRRGGSVKKTAEQEFYSALGLVPEGYPEEGPLADNLDRCPACNQDALMFDTMGNPSCYNCGWTPEQADEYIPEKWSASVAPPQALTQPAQMPAGQAAEAQAEINRMVQQYIGQGVDVATAYQQAALEYQKQQVGKPVPGAVAPAVPSAPTAIPAYTSRLNDVVEQDGDARANLKCTNCGGQTIKYAGDDKFFCQTCGNEMTYDVRRDKASAYEGSPFGNAFRNMVDEFKHDNQIAKDGDNVVVNSMLQLGNLLAAGVIGPFIFAQDFINELEKKRRQSAAGSDPSTVVQDGEVRANLKCTNPECGSQSIAYAGEDKFVCRVCGTEITYDFRKDKSSSNKLAWVDNIENPRVREIIERYAQSGAPDRDTFDQMQMELQQVDPTGMSWMDALKWFGHKVNNLIPSRTTKEARWTDINGDPLRVGREYKMSHPDHPIPDFIRVTFIEPESVRVGFEVSGYENDIDDDRFEFEPLDNLMDRTAAAPDLEWLRPEGSPGEEALVNPDLFKEAGRSFSLNEQRDLIDEPGSARNIDRLNLRGTHYRDEFGITIDPENPDLLSDEDVMLF